MQANLVGVHRVKKVLADGGVRYYFYAWRGGPRMKSNPDSRDFVAEYVRLTRDRQDAPFQGHMAQLIRAYIASPAYTELKPSTREGYDIAIKAIETDFFNMTYEKISAVGTRAIFLDWRDEIARGVYDIKREKMIPHKRKADLFMSVLQRILKFGVGRELIARHPLEDVEKISSGTRRDIIWSDEEIARFKTSASEPLVRAMMLGLWTGQRQGDLLALTWKSYDGTSIGLRQGKTGAHVRVKVSTELKSVLDAAKRENAKQKTPAASILTNGQGKPWASGFKSSWRKAVANADLENRTFHDLRGTFVTLAYRNGSSIKEIAEVTGHSEKDAESIIRKHYLVSSAAVESIENGLQKIENVE